LRVFTINKTETAVLQWEPSRTLGDAEFGPPKPYRIASKSHDNIASASGVDVKEKGVHFGNVYVLEDLPKRTRFRIQQNFAGAHFDDCNPVFWTDYSVWCALQNGEVGFVFAEIVTTENPRYSPESHPLAVLAVTQIGKGPNNRACLAVQDIGLSIRTNEDVTRGCHFEMFDPSGSAVFPDLATLGSESGDRNE
jgi:hypothetical protein